VSDLSAPMEDMFSAQLRYFVSCVADRQPPRLCPPGETCQVMRVMTASRQSADSGKVITLDEGLGLAE
jgi:predicted dehydrogenase